MADKGLVVLEESTVARVRIEDQMRIVHGLEHRVGVLRRQHGVVTTANHVVGCLMARNIACSGSGVAHQVISALACGSVTALPL